MKKIVCSVIFCLLATTIFSQQKIITGADRTEAYIPLLKGKRIGVFANHTSQINGVHLVDSLIKRGIKITKAFGPEHGFRGKADAGEKVDNYIDDATGIPVISLYGKKRKPNAEDLADIDILLFDIQDVGVRFYTYISSLEEFIEAALENKKPLLILDRPNPNGHYVDGPVLDTAYKSFVGMQPIPIVYGMTIGEYAFMIAGEKRFSQKANAQYDYYKTAQNSTDTPFHFQVIKCKNYNHKTFYELPVKPSPNLADMESIYWYPSTCFFEGTVCSEGRGTEHPFCIFGHPSLKEKYNYSFTPISRDGAKDPKLKNELCYGYNLYNNNFAKTRKKVDNKIQLKYIIDVYKKFPEKNNFFIKPKTDVPTNYVFNKLAGNSLLMQQIKDGKTEKLIRKSWEVDLKKFKEIRKKYLLYKDFE